MNLGSADICKSIAIYALEAVFFYALSFFVVYLVAPPKAVFLAGLSLFFFVCACLIGRPAAPHLLFMLLTRPAIFLMCFVVIGFGVFGTGELDLTVFAPALSLSLLGAAFADRVEKSHHKKSKADK
ncbi:hypothetical protein IHE31_06270 [Mycetohabitans rhizoxinica]|uniref:hypothetical protein n=1 Tax=Mycetohabitans rhizoxinica TaxID=412963 RepID=UPI0030CFC4B8